MKPPSARWLLAALSLILVSTPLPAQVIPAGRTIDWSRAGVPGGIPHRTTLCATIDAGTYGDGVTDASAAINAALQSCPEEQVVYLPPGNYRLDDAINFQYWSHVTLRGAGVGQTVLLPQSTTSAAITTGQTNLSAARPIQSGATKGSTVIVVSDASDIAAGTILDIFQADDPDFYWTRGLTEHTGQFVRVTGVNGTTVELEDPLVWDFTQNPRCRVETAGPGLSWSGVEALTISADATYGGSMIQLWNAYACWIKNVETAWGNGNEHIFLYSCLRCEVRDSYIHDTHSTTDGYGIVTMSGYGGPRGGCTGTRIENNVFSGLWYATVLETEVGSVVAYNFSRDMSFPGWPDYQIPDFNGNHGPHGMMVLWEGNAAAGGIQQDGYHGSVSHSSYFRNFFSGKHVEVNRTGNVKLFDLCRYSYYHSVVGNVLGSPDWPRATTGRYEMTGMPDYSAQAVIYRLGYPNMGNNGYSETNPPSNADDGGLDPKVKATLMRWGNFDYQSNAARWDEAEIPAGLPVPPDHVLSASLLYGGKPPWWPDGVAWPPIGPEVTGGDADPGGYAHKIPAQICFEKGSAALVAVCLVATGTPDTTAPAAPTNLVVQ